MLNYRKTHFDPARLRGFTRIDREGREDWSFDLGAKVDPRHFAVAEEAVLALNVALATKRPLLVSGEPGNGKTTLARVAALALSRVFYRQTVTSRLQASDLLASFDALRRLSDAQGGGAKVPQAYVVPGPLWWALAPVTAAQRGLSLVPELAPLVDPGVRRRLGAKSAVLLLDEIDKADPDVPNDLLEALDESRFTVPETGEHIEPESGRGRNGVLIVLTTNGERELPPAFLRRCVTLELPPPSEDWLVDIAQRRFGAVSGHFGLPLYRKVALEMMDLRQRAADQGRRPPGTSEYVDAVLACRELLHESTLRGGDDVELLRILETVLAKGTAAAPAAGG